MFYSLSFNQLIFIVDIPMIKKAVIWNIVQCSITERKRERMDIWLINT